jgi:GNAT superfamily N-acetyltransferase
VVLKTIAVAPDYAGAGLGTLLMDRCHAAADALGYTRAIHALMHEDNRSLRVSRRYTRPMRRYALFGRSLASSPR